MPKTITVKGEKYFQKGKNYSCELVTAGKGAKVLYCHQKPSNLSGLGRYLEKDIAQVEIEGNDYICDLHSMKTGYGGKRLYCHQVPATSTIKKLNVLTKKEKKTLTNAFKNLDKGYLLKPAQWKTVKKAGYTRHELMDRFFRGAKRMRKKTGKQYQEKLMKSGEGMRWYIKKAKNKGLINQTDEALHIIEGLYNQIYDAGKQKGNKRIIKAEDMILKVSRSGNSEGIIAKQAPYQNDNIKISIRGYTGPRNLDATTQTIEFEEGAKPFRFVLAYQDGLPTKQQLIQDVAAYGKISKERSGKGIFDEGEQPAYRRIPFHKRMKIG